MNKSITTALFLAMSFLFVASASFSNLTGFFNARSAFIAAPVESIVPAPLPVLSVPNHSTPYQPVIRSISTTARPAAFSPNKANASAAMTSEPEQAQLLEIADNAIKAPSAANINSELPNNAKPSANNDWPPLSPVVEPSPATDTNINTNKLNNISPTLIVYQDEIVVEFLADATSTQTIQKVIKNILLSVQPFNEIDLLGETLSYSMKLPYLWRKVLDQKQQPIRYPLAAQNYADYLIKNAMTQVDDEEGHFLQLHIPLHTVGLVGPAQQYQNWVIDYAQTYGVSPALIYAIMETESSFNPKAVSRSNAIGLMQLKAETAGVDVFRRVDEKMGQPTESELLDSEKNIRMGTAYLGLLQHDYFAEIKSEENKKLLSIASYNGGMKAVINLFGNTPEKAMTRINQLQPKQIYRKLRTQHQSPETRRYLDKVLAAEKRYQKMLNG